MKYSSCHRNNISRSMANLFIRDNLAVCARIIRQLFASAYKASTPGYSYRHGDRYIGKGYGMKIDLV